MSLIDWNLEWFAIEVAIAIYQQKYTAIMIEVATITTAH